MWLVKLRSLVSTLKKESNHTLKRGEIKSLKIDIFYNLSYEKSPYFSFAYDKWQLWNVLLLTLSFCFREWYFPLLFFFTSFRVCWAYCVGLECLYMLRFANLNKIDLIKVETFIRALSGYWKVYFERNSHPHYWI